MLLSMQNHIFLIEYYDTLIIIINLLAVGLLLIVAAILVYFIEASLYGVNYFSAILPIVFSIIGIGLVLWYIINRNHKE